MCIGIPAVTMHTAPSQHGLQSCVKQGPSKLAAAAAAAAAASAAAVLVRQYLELLYAGIEAMHGCDQVWGSVLDLHDAFWLQHPACCSRVGVHLHLHSRHVLLHIATL